VGVGVMVGVKMGVEVTVSVGVSVGNIGVTVSVCGGVMIGDTTGAQAFRSKAQNAKHETRNANFDLMRLSKSKKHL
jgi:hypothetical protein